MPQVGDVFLRRTKGNGHTGIITSVDLENGTVIMMEARGTDIKTEENTRTISKLQNQKGFQGFFRPEVETQTNAEEGILKKEITQKKPSVQKIPSKIPAESSKPAKSGFFEKLGQMLTEFERSLINRVK